MSFYDIYLDNIRDFGKYVQDDLNKIRDIGSISAETLEQEWLEVHERHQGEIYIRGLQQTPIKKAKDAAHIIERGQELRTIVDKKLYYSSLRSHTVFMLTFKNQ